jgi:hypothetical protein
VPRRLLALLAAAGVALVAVLVLRGGDPPPALVDDPPSLAADPLAWTPDRSDEYAERAADGLAHVLYQKSPGGIEASAARTASWRPLIDEVAERTGEDADTLEAIVLLESAGRAEVRASESFEGAVGLTQILAETGRNLLGLRVDPAASRRITERLDRALRRRQDERAERLRAERRRVDERYDPRRALEGTARYLEFARSRLDRDDLAVASYHMGVGNVETALRRYGASEPIPYVQLFFDSTPLRHAEAASFLAALGDDSSTYLWRVEAAREVMRLHRQDREELGRRAVLHAMRNSAEVFLHPPEDTETFEDSGDLDDAIDDGEIAPLPAAWLAQRGIVIDRAMGALSDEPERYRALRREALATLGYIGQRVRRIARERQPLRLTSTVRDEDYQERLRLVEVEATGGYSLHTTGFAFDIARDYAGRAQAQAFQHVLDRLTALNLIAWVREPGAIHVTVSSDAARLQDPLGVRED